MPLYKCKICDEKGKKSILLREACDEQSLIASFIQEKRFLLAYDIHNTLKYTKKGINLKSLLDFTDIFSSLLNSCVTVQRALELTAQITQKTQIGDLARELYSVVRQGKPLHQAMKLFPNTFSPFYVSMVRLGEKTGEPEIVFKRISSYLHKKTEIREKIKSALLYPLFVIVLVVFLVIGLLFFGFPKLTNMIMEFNSGNTNVILDKMHTLYTVFYTVGITFGFFVLLFLFLCFMRKRNECIAFWIDNFILKIPLVGNLIILLQTIDFAFIMELLSGSVIPLQESLEEAEESVTNVCFKQELSKIKEAVEKGSSLSSAFLLTKYFPAYVHTWLEVGEQTGNMEKVFFQIRNFFQDESERKLKNIVTLLEPAFILFAGLIIILVIVNLILPIFTMYGMVL